MAKTNPHKGSSFDDFLKQDGIYDDVTRLARRKELAWQLEEAKAQVKRLAADYKLAKQVADNLTLRLSSTSRVASPREIPVLLNATA